MRLRRSYMCALTVGASLLYPGVGSADPAEVNRCTEVSPLGTPSCLLQSSDGPGPGFEKTSVPAPEGQTTTIRVLEPTGAVHQTITEPYKGFGSAPMALRDLDQDGRDELLVGVDTRQRHVRWAVWRATQSGYTYSRAGEVFGEAYGAGPDLIGVRADSDIAFLVFDAGILRTIADVDIDGAGSCSLTMRSGINKLGWSPVDAEKNLCGALR